MHFHFTSREAQKDWLAVILLDAAGLKGASTTPVLRQFHKDFIKHLPRSEKLPNIRPSLQDLRRNGRFRSGAVPLGRRGAARKASQKNDDKVVDEGKKVLHNLVSLLQRKQRQERGKRSGSKTLPNKVWWREIFNKQTADKCGRLVMDARV
jgi:hypothetical protein